MTAAQRQALDLAAEADGKSVRIAPVTGRILHQRYGYLEPTTTGWQLTPRGWAYLSGVRAEQRFQEVDGRLQPEHRAWADRIMHWMDAHERLSPAQAPARRYLRHMAACLRAGIEPAVVGRWTDAGLDWARREVEAATRILEDFDEQAELAVERGVGVSVGYNADPKVARSRRDAAAAANEGGVVKLSTYRQRRP